MVVGLVGKNEKDRSERDGRREVGKERRERDGHSLRGLEDLDRVGRGLGEPRKAGL